MDYTDGELHLNHSYMASFAQLGARSTQPFLITDYTDFEWITQLENYITTIPTGISFAQLGARSSQHFLRFHQK